MANKGFVVTCAAALLLAAARAQACDDGTCDDAAADESVLLAVGRQQRALRKLAATEAGFCCWWSPSSSCAGCEQKSPDTGGCGGRPCMQAECPAAEHSAQSGFWCGTAPAPPPPTPPPPPPPPSGQGYCCWWSNSKSCAGCTEKSPDTGGCGGRPCVEAECPAAEGSANTGFWCAAAATPVPQPTPPPATPAPVPPSTPVPAPQPTPQPTPQQAGYCCWWSSSKSCAGCTKKSGATGCDDGSRACGWQDCPKPEGTAETQFWCTEQAAGPPGFAECLKGEGSSPWTYLPGELFVANATGGYNLKDLHNARVTNAVSPSAVVFASEAKHVQVAVACAGRFGKAAYGRSGMNQYEASCADFEGGGAGCVLVDTSNLQEVTWGEGCAGGKAGCTAVLGPGLSLGKAYMTLKDRGYAIPAGTCAQVRVAGLTLGGGKGWLTKKYGMLSDRLVGIDAVLLDGRLVHANATREKELLWLARGGGGNIFPGVVTAFYFDLVPVPADDKIPYQLITWKQPSAACAAKVMAEWYKRMALYEDNNLWSRLAVQNWGTPELLIKALYAGTDASAQQAAMGKLAEVQAAAGCGETTPSTPTVSYKTWVQVASEANDMATEAELRSLNCGWRLQAGKKPERTTCYGFDAMYYLQWAWRSLIFGAGKKVEQGLWDALASTKMWQELTYYAEIDPINGFTATLPGDAAAFPHRDAGYILLQQVMRSDADISGSMKESAGLFRNMTKYTERNVAYYNYLDKDMGAYGANARQAYYGGNAERLEKVLRAYTEELVSNDCDRCRSWEMQ